MNEERPVCPECGSPDVVPIRYGRPGPELQAAAKRGEVHLGGDIVTGADPSKRCRRCGHQWDFDE